MNFKETVSFSLSRIGLIHRNLLERFLIPIGLHSGQVFVLFELWETDGQRQIDLAEKLSIAPPTLNKIVSGMIESKLIERKRSEGDARSSRIYLTDVGRKIRFEVEQAWTQIESATLEPLTPAERIILGELIGKMLGRNV